MRLFDRYEVWLITVFLDWTDFGVLGQGFGGAVGLKFEFRLLQVWLLFDRGFGC